MPTSVGQVLSVDPDQARPYVLSSFLLHMNDSQPIKTASSFLPSLNFGNGLIEIAALTTLIGSTTAGDLILGNRGAAGIVWGSISAFGSSSVIKACASAASPGWLRQMLGLRTTSSDGTVGMDLSLDRRKNVAKRMRGTLDVPLGVCSLSSDSDHSVSRDLRPSQVRTLIGIHLFLAS